MLRKLAPLLTLSLLAGCVTTDPRYREVTLLDNGNYALSSQSVDAFQSEREVVQRARQHCAQQQRGYREIDQQSSYVNGASGPMHRVTVYFQCPDAEDSPAVSVPAAEPTGAAAVAATASAPLAIDSVAAPATGSAVSTGAPATTTPVAAVAGAAVAVSVIGKAEPKPPYQEVTALSESRFGITRQSLEPFQSSQAVLAQAQRYCEERQLHVDEVDRQIDYVKGSGNEQAHRVTLYFRCQSATVAMAAALSPQPPFQEVTALGEGRYGITRQSLEPFQSGHAVQAQAERYCGEQQQNAEQIDQEKRYVNRGSNEPAHRTTLYFRCTP